MSEIQNTADENEIDDSLEQEEGTSEGELFQYNIDSYTNAVPVERLIEDFERDLIKIPPFQRPYVWNKKDGTSNRHRPSLFIDSVMLGLPIPPMMIYRDVEAREKGYLIDGRQRLETLSFFKRGYFGRKDLSYPESKKVVFKLIGDSINSQWKNLSYNDEDFAKFKDVFDRSFVPVMYIRQIKKDREDTPGASSIYLLFDRLNSGGIALHPHERRGVLGINNESLTNLFSNVIYKYSEWHKIFPPSLLDFDKKPENETKCKEYIFRIYAFLLFRDKYAGSTAKFLNSFMQEYRIEDVTNKEIVDISPKVLTILVKAKEKQPDLFRPNKGFNVVLLDSIFIGLYTYIQNYGNMDLDAFITKYNEYVGAKSYLPIKRESTASSSFVKERIIKAIEVFNG